MAESTYSNEAAERAALGAALLGNVDGFTSLDPRVDYTDPRCLAVAAAIGALLDAGTVPTPAATLRELQQDREFPWTRTSNVGVFLADLIDVDTTPSPAASSYDAIAVRECTARRRLVVASTRLVDWASGPLDSTRVVNAVTGELTDVAAYVARIAPWSNEAA